MKVLAFDTATAACSAAVWHDGRTLAARQREMARGQSEALLPMISEVLAESGLGVAAIDLLAVTIGPGSFTGIRLGLSAARGLALAAGLPCVGVTTLEALAHTVGSAERTVGDAVLAVIDSKRGDVFVQVFDHALRPLAEPWSGRPEAVAGDAPKGRLLVVGDAATTMLTVLARLGRDARLGSAAISADPALVAALAAERLVGHPSPPAPLYLRPADTTAPSR